VGHWTQEDVPPGREEFVRANAVVLVEERDRLITRLRREVTQLRKLVTARNAELARVLGKYRELYAGWLEAQRRWDAMRDRYLGVGNPEQPGGETSQARDPQAVVDPVPVADEVTRERDACLTACRRVLVEGPIPHSLVAAYEEIRGLVESGQHREATP
jgi:hypothetical protein